MHSPSRACALLLCCLLLSTGPAWCTSANSNSRSSAMHASTHLSHSSSAVGPGSLSLRDRIMPQFSPSTALSFLEADTSVEKQCLNSRVCCRHNTEMMLCPHANGVCCTGVSSGFCCRPGQTCSSTPGSTSPVCTGPAASASTLGSASQAAKKKKKQNVIVSNGNQVIDITRPAYDGVDDDIGSKHKRKSLKEYEREEAQRELQSQEKAMMDMTPQMTDADRQALQKVANLEATQKMGTGVPAL